VFENIGYLGVATAVGAFLFVFGVMLPMLYRNVVTTNMVHIVQRGRKTTPYGSGENAGNVYYKWPAWVPHFGVTIIALPVSNFDLTLKSYEAYDKDRVPFEVDVTAFFRIADTAQAAQRVASIVELKEQLTQIIQGAVRKVLASDEINAIMVERAKFGDAFTVEVKEQLKEWGIHTVKSMELMDIRDSGNGASIQNIMAKKISHIAMESRIEVANNKQAAEVAEINAAQTVSVRKQESEQIIGQRTAERNQAVGIAEQKSTQAVLGEKKSTTEAEMQVLQVKQVREAEIQKVQQVVNAEQNKQTTILAAEGRLEAQKREAEGVTLLGEAQGNAETAKLMAPVNAQLALAKEVGGNEGYQKYLAMLEAIRAYITVGSKQAEALKDADVKIIANASKPAEGMKTVMDIFSTEGGTHLGGMVEAFSQTPLGQAVLDKFGVKGNEKNLEKTD